MKKQDLENFLIDIKVDREHNKLGELSEFRKDVLASKEAIYKHLTLYSVVASLPKKKKKKKKETVWDVKTKIAERNIGKLR